MAEKTKAQQLNVRLTEEAMEEFKKIAEERHMTQTDAFQLAFTALKAEKKKHDHPENSKAIGEAQRHASNLIGLVTKAYDEKSVQFKQPKTNTVHSLKGKTQNLKNSLKAQKKALT